MNRRQFLGTLSLAFTAALSDDLRRVLAQAPAGVFAPAPADERDPVMHVINRLTYGVTPALYAHVRSIGAQAFIDEQLAPEQLDTSEADRRTAIYADILNENGGILAQTYRDQRQEVATALIGSTTLHALYSERQLYERLVQVFSDHLSIYIGGQTLFLKIDDDRDVIRPHVLASFRALLGASAHSPAMLVYLDNARSTKDKPNENYARELLELHTLGVQGGYTENDVREVARALTGWSVQREQSTTGAIAFRFRRRLHDMDAKTILGTAFPARGLEEEGERLLDLLAAHPSTARLISTKLARRFISDTPPDSVIETGAAAFLASSGDLRAVLRAILNAPEFWNAPPKFKQPYEYVLSTLRPFSYDVHDDRRFMRGLRAPLDAMGHIPFTWPAPNGFPDVAAHWTASLLTRWNVALSVASNQVPGAAANLDPLFALLAAEGATLEPDSALSFLARYLFGRALTADEQTILLDFVRAAPGGNTEQIAAGIALLLASPAYQYR